MYINEISFPGTFKLDRVLLRNILKDYCKIMPKKSVNLSDCIHLLLFTILTSPSCHPKISFKDNLKDSITLAVTKYIKCRHNH